MTKIIAEVCQNHNGDMALFEKMIKAAADNGADIIKMQSIWSDDVTRRDRFEEGTVDEDGNQTAIKRPYQAEVDRLSELDITIDDHNFFIKKCEELGVQPMTTVFSRNRVKEVGELDWPNKIVKIASYDCASKPLLRELAEYFDTFIISTGATYDDEIKETAELMKELGKEFHFLHCVTSYPNTLDMCHLHRMEWLRQFTDKVGWSDHSHIGNDGILAAKVAIMLGADFIERHFTIQGPEDSKDGPVSMTPELLKELSEFRNLSKEEQKANIEASNPNWEITLGEKEREMTQTELLNRDYYRGRFAASDGEGGWIYNWEDKPLV